MQELDAALSTVIFMAAAIEALDTEPAEAALSGVRCWTIRARISPWR